MGRRPEAGDLSCAEPRRATMAAWLFDHVLRSEESYGEKWLYVRDNPVRAGLVDDASDWPYQGECVVIDRL